MKFIWELIWDYEVLKVYEKQLINYLIMKKFIILCIFCISFYNTFIFAQIPTNGLVFYYPFNGNANDEGGNRANGVVNGAKLTKDRCNIDSKAYYFDGIDDNINIGDISNLDGLNTLSISVWIYSDGIKEQNSGTIISKYNANGNSERVFIFDLYPDNTLRICIYGPDGNENYVKQRTSNPIPFSQWNHIVVNWNGLKHNIDFYVNGVEVESNYEKNGDNPNTEIYNKTSPLMIGGSDFGFTSPDYMFNGSIDEVRIYNRELTYAEILSLYYYDCQNLNIIGENQVCQGQQNVSYTIQSSNKINDYQWTYSGTGVHIIGDSSAVVLNFDDNATNGNLSVTISGNSISTQSVELPITVNQLPHNAGIISGTNNICAGQNGINYSIPLIDNATSYTWNYSGIGASIIGTSNSININFLQNATNGYLTVVGSNSCGVGAISPEFPINITVPPSNAGIINGSHEVCVNQGGVAYSIPIINNANNYIWNYSGTNATLLGEKDNISIYFFNNATSGNLTVYGTNICGNGQKSQDFPIIVKTCTEKPINNITTVRLK
jgi:hypothetical protein